MLICVAGWAAGGSGMQIVRDSLGKECVPTVANYGIHTTCVHENFRFSRITVSDLPGLLGVFALAGKRTCPAKYGLGELSTQKARATQKTFDEIAVGYRHDSVVTEVVHRAADTSAKMNATEVIANIAQA